MDNNMPIAEIRINTEGIDDYLQKAERLITLMQEAKTIIRELAASDLLEANLFSGIQS